MRLRVPHPYQKIKKEENNEETNVASFSSAGDMEKCATPTVVALVFGHLWELSLVAPPRGSTSNAPVNWASENLCCQTCRRAPWNYVQTQLQLYASTLFGGKCKLIFRRLFAAVPIKYERSAFRSRLFCLGLHFWFMQILLVSPWLQLQFQTSDS